MKNKRLEMMLARFPEYINRGGADTCLGGLLYGEMLLPRYSTRVTDKVNKRQ